MTASIVYMYNYDQISISNYRNDSYHHHQVFSVLSYFEDRTSIKIFSAEGVATSYVVNMHCLFLQNGRIPSSPSTGLTGMTN